MSSQSKSLKKNLKKYSPYIRSTKRLTILLEECTATQQDLKETWKNIFQSATTSRKLLQDLKNTSTSRYTNEIFKSEYEKHKKKRQSGVLTEKKKKNEAMIIVDSIIKSPIIGEKFSLNRTDQKRDISTPEKLLIGFEELKKAQIQELLMANRRKFGENFKSELVVPAKKSIFVRKTTIKGGFQKDFKDLQGKLKGLGSGTVSQMSFPYASKKVLKKEEREMLQSILQEKKNTSERFKIQKYMGKRSDLL